MVDVRVVELASDPNLVPGIYNTCDQWCDYCPATTRCLSFKVHGGVDAFGDVHGDFGAAMFASMGHLRDCYEAEGLEPPEDMRLLLSGERRRFTQWQTDPIERAAHLYLMLVATFMHTSDDRVLRVSFAKRPAGPTPAEVFLFYHFTIGVKAGRAVASAREADRTGRAAARRDAECSAKVALLAIDRSDEALQVLALDVADARLAHLRAHLEQLRRDLERRFPNARAIMRPGLDETDRP